MQIICAGLLVAGAAQAQAVAKPVPAVRARPSSQELVRLYTAAAGVDGLLAVHTRSCQGEVERTPSGTSAGAGIARLSAHVELDWKEPGRAREVWSNASIRTRRISDGEHGWQVGTGESRRELQPPERVELSRLAALYQPASVLPLEELAFSRNDKVGDRAAWVLQAKSGELLWLDQETNLPLRLDLLVERPEPSRAGEFYLTQVFFEDWQPAPVAAPPPGKGPVAQVSQATILLPRTLRRVLAQGTLVYRFTQVQQDLELSNGLFKIPYFWRK